MADLIDPTVAGKYPVILGEGLLGKGSGSNEVFTSIRYNHKPELSSEDAPSQAKLKPTTPGKTTSYDLTYTDGDSYAFRGVRNTGNDQYVLYFDPERKAFVLDKVDSSFDMNVTRLPGNSKPDDLARQFPHLGLSSSSSSSSAKPAPAAKAPVSKPAKKAAKEPTVMAMPTASKPQKKKKTDNDEDDEDDDDGGLLIEYPDAPRATKKADFSPAFPTQRRFDDYMDQRESEADDADGESDDEPDMDFKLPSPVNKAAEPAEAEAEAEVEEEEDDDDAIDLEADLEKEMEIAFEDLANSQEEARGGDESEISEED